MSFTTPAPPAPTAPPVAAAFRSACRQGPGGRTPDPQGGRLPLPGYGAGVVQAVARANPGALANSCQEPRRLLAVHGSGRRHAAHLRHALGLQRQARQRQRSVAWTSIAYHYGAGRGRKARPRSTSSTSSAGTAARRPSPSWNDVTDITLQLRHDRPLDQPRDDSRDANAESRCKP